MPDDKTQEYHKVVEAATRIRQTLRQAKKGKHYRDAWYFYVKRQDVERLVTNILGPEEDDTL